MLAQFALFDGYAPLDAIPPSEAFTGQVSAEVAHADGPRGARSEIPAVTVTATTHHHAPKEA